ncbi:MAG: response regulator [Cyanobacteria bacterium P01_F01_bin.150]
MENILVRQLTECFQQCHREQFTGKICAYTRTGQQWPVYFLMGRLVWASGGSHRFRRWFRLLNKHLSYVDISKLPRPELSTTHLWEYSVLSSLLRQHRVLNTSVYSFIDEAIGEVFFEILQEATGLRKSTKSLPRIKNLGSPITMLRSDISLKNARHEWDQWRQAGLISYSPNFAPRIKYPDTLKQRISEPIYSKLSLLITGERSLREISDHLKASPLSVSKSLLPFVNQGIISLNSIPDWGPFTHVPGEGFELERHPSSSTIDANRPLILCIDDNPNICKTLEKIIKANGYRFLAEQDSLQALPTMLEHKPDFIFLDLIMPIASGYEICAQIRRISAFDTIPVVILTGKDGMVDRVRAKLVGASDFLAKPIHPRKVLNVVERYLAITSNHNLTNLSEGYLSE